MIKLINIGRVPILIDLSFFLYLHAHRTSIKHFFPSLRFGPEKCNVSMIGSECSQETSQVTFLWLSTIKLLFRVPLLNIQFVVGFSLRNFILVHMMLTSQTFKLIFNIFQKVGFIYDTLVFAILTT